MQMSLIHETLNDALREVIQAAGGPKKVGAEMFPEKTIDEAAGRIRDCLNVDRREVFNPDQVMYLLRLGRRVGCHAAISYMNHDAGYADPLPVEPEDEVARLQRDYIEATKALLAMASKIDGLQQTSQLRRAA
jgi:hypothetical protein